uniref:Uncharacterized protein n=1 Tax=Arundo donax TaxID=35708 RepID=A0A0A9HL95_ARUDO
MFCDEDFLTCLVFTNHMPFNFF